MIKVCMVGISYYFGDARVRQYAQFLSQAGHQVDVLCLHEFNTKSVLNEDGVRIFSIPFSRTRKSRFTYLFEFIFSLLLTGLWVTRLHLKNRYDVIHVHNMPDLLVFSCLIPKMLGARIVLDIHDLMPEVYLSKYPNGKGGIVWRILCAEEKLSTLFADAVITANRHFKENLVRRRIPASKITVVHNFPDPHIFNHSKRKDRGEEDNGQFTLIFPGTIAPRYGLDVAIRSLPLLKERIEHIRLLIIGQSTECKQELISLAEQLGVSTAVEFQHAIPNKEVPNLLVQAKVGIYPALPDCHMSFAVPGKLLEFAIMGLPIVSSRLKIVEEMFDDSAVLFFEPGNAHEFAECVLRLYNEPALSKQLVTRADQILAQRLRGERELQGYAELLGCLLPNDHVVPSSAQDKE